ncbi:hypothetical protein CEXT_400251 [Caerostris extrusa]|uniref:Uncharacterized protein n=1 Tax=Caerostris extrusa TaxID=172846 RepID=A0AAV4Q8C5_CAEEX|nr:hypothetical protein CEXT_400251 [Caerostris extrusa]
MFVFLRSMRGAGGFFNCTVDVRGRDAERWSGIPSSSPRNVCNGSYWRAPKDSETSILNSKVPMLHQGRRAPYLYTPKSPPCEFADESAMMFTPNCHKRKRSVPQMSATQSREREESRCIQREVRCGNGEEHRALSWMPPADRKEEEIGGSSSEGSRKLILASYY